MTCDLEEATRPVAALRRRRLTLPPDGLAVTGFLCSRACSPGGSRFSPLLEDASLKEDDDCASVTPFDAAMDVLDDGPSPGWLGDGDAEG